MAPKNAFYAQSGGVTSVINASAAGVIETARKYPKKIGKKFFGKKKRKKKQEGKKKKKGRKEFF